MEQSEHMGIQILAACEPDYPKYLRAVDPCPLSSAYGGRSDILHQPCIAIVGSRNASAIGQRFARQISGQLCEAGYTIVSGLARGIDASAHHAALPTGTAAVLGGGVDHIYPPQNTELYQAMAEQGALISESPLGYRATARDFPRCNRIISGLSMGVVVIEAAERSGTLITARYALEQNREVMAAPGSPWTRAPRAAIGSYNKAQRLLKMSTISLLVLKMSVHRKLWNLLRTMIKPNLIGRARRAISTKLKRQ